MYQLVVLNRHLLLNLGDKLALVDTGSPYDIGRGEATTLLGKSWKPSTEHRVVCDTASVHLGVDVDWVIGYPTLKAARLLLDWRARRAVLAREPIPLADAAALAIDLSKPVPLIDMTVGDETVRAVLDSGAALSYVPPAAVVGRAPIRRERDFHPTIGPFDVDVWTVPIFVGGRAITMEAGLLPEELALVLGAVSGGWILGNDFFRDRAVVIAYPDGVVLDAPSAG